MAVTRTIDESAPNGAVALASDIDTVIKEHKVDLRERMNDLGCTGWQALTAGQTPVWAYLRMANAAAIKDAAAANDVISWVSQRYVKFPSQPKCSVYQSSAIAITGAWQILTFASEAYDNASMHDTGVNTGRITIPTGGDGYYHVTASVPIYYDGGSVVNAVVALALYKNGVTLHPTYPLHGFKLDSIGSSVSDPMYTFSMSYIVSLVAGDYLELRVNSIDTNKKYNNAHFAAHLLP